MSVNISTLARAWAMSGTALLLIVGCSAQSTPSPIEDIPASASPAADVEEPDSTAPIMTDTPAAPDPVEDASPEITPTDDAPAVTSIPVDSGTASAVADLAARLGIEEAAIRVVSVEAVTWPDSSLGCPQPGYAYMQVLTEGRLIVLEVDGVTYEYHSGGGQPPFLCERGLIVPEITPKGGDELIPPPGSGEDT